MNKIPPSLRIKQAIHELLEAGLQGDINVLSELLRLGAQRLVQEILEQEVIDFLGRDHYEHRGKGAPLTGYRNGYRPREVRTAEGPIAVSVPQVRQTTVPFESRIRFYSSFWT